ncbi:MAG: OmpA family protein [Fibrobacteres bacterium]|jgi:outer membrane protein OmpA-like peptidoglycan-associated protein|nr:OmpA family protein [Fibrobacterota bacterium]
MKLTYAALLMASALLAKPLHAFDSDDDGIPNKYDLCPHDPEDKDGFQDQDGCPDPDNDSDGVCDPWVVEKGQQAKYANVCHGSDKCVEVPEDKDGFQDDDGCPDPDNDKDGIPDSKDKCPNDPEDMDGFQDNDGCPDPDNDGDGICDPWVAEKGQQSKYANVCHGSDKCANEAEDKDGFEDEDGCPDPDNDKDGIKDAVDKCPNEPETMNGVEDEDGCPDHESPALQPLQSYPLVRFRSSTAELTVEAEPDLDKIAKQLTEYKDKKVEIRVYTWYKGKKKEDYLALLQARSKAIVDYLVSKGVKPEQLQEVQYTKENFESLKGSEQDFNQEKPFEVRLLN